MPRQTDSLEEMRRAAGLPGGLRVPAADGIVRRGSVAELSALATALPVLQRTGETPVAPGMTSSRAFELLVSAACYLSLSPARNPGDHELEAVLEAVQLLHDLSAELGILTGEAEDVVWAGTRARWDRWNSARPAAQAMTGFAEKHSGE